MTTSQGAGQQPDPDFIHPDDRPPRPRRPFPTRVTLLTAAVVVLLIAAIALAGHDWTEDASETGVLSTEPEQSEAGAQRAAAAIAAAIGGEDMFAPGSRTQLLRRVAHPDVEAEIQEESEQAYSRLASRIGLSADGTAPGDAVFIARTMPAGTSIRAYSPDTAVVRVWAHGIMDLAGPGPEAAADPVSESWFTMTLTLRWHGDRWRLMNTEQTSGPTPNDDRVHEMVGQRPPM
ncbi:hypothetical protein [Streptomyces globisporus]|uniref:hypothetical protein n=1 Tax=Streptomyces globisporus TaxID=1908 RepID=UPI0033FD04DA